MKKLILSIAILSGVALTTTAQTEKGKVIVGGTASYSSMKSDAEGARAAEQLSLVPNIGYFVKDNLALGTGLGYNYSKSGVASLTGQNESFVVSPFGRYYVGLSEQFRFFGQASVPMAFGTVKSTDEKGEAGDKTGSSTSIGVALSPGFAYFPTKRIGIEFSFQGLSYNNYSVKDNNDDEIKGAGNESFSVGTNFFTPQIGVQFHF